MKSLKDILEGDVIPFPKKKLPIVSVIASSKGMYGQHHYTVRNTDNDMVYHFIKPKGAPIYGTHIGNIDDTEAHAAHKAVLNHYNDRGKI